MRTRNDLRASQALTRLLQRQRTALREGRLQELADMVPEMERALETLPDQADASDHPNLQQLAAENARLLQAAVQGVAQAREMRNGAARINLTTYDASGRKLAQAPSAGRTLSRR